MPGPSLVLPTHLISAYAPYLCLTLISCLVEEPWCEETPFLPPVPVSGQFLGLRA